MLQRCGVLSSKPSAPPKQSVCLPAARQRSDGARRLCERLNAAERDQSSFAKGWQQNDIRFDGQGSAASPRDPPPPRPSLPVAHPSTRGEDSGQDAELSDNNVELYYSTGWRHPTMLYSVQGGEWSRKVMHEVASSSGKWKCAQFPLNGASSPDAPALEFVITDTGELWDKPWQGGNYRIPRKGKFILRDGEIEAVPGRSVLVVSDLDDTMIGDDAATAAFKAFWESTAVPRGSRLVYNTGRALHKWQSLIEEKRGILAPPDVLISSVGTKVYNCVGGEWKEDAGYAAQLDEAWDLEVVREATYAALASVGREHMHFRPPDEQNAHKVTCGVAVMVLDDVLRRIKRSLKAGGMQARLITSGTGDWRFLDIVSVRAGKLEALEYVRKQMGFPHSSTLACGDSGNDIDMLEGKNLAVVVANAQKDLLKWLIKEKERSKAAGEPKRLLAARRERAEGIMEALDVFGFL